MDFSCFFYRVVLSLYPARFRAEFGAQMIQTFRDNYNDARQSHGGVGLSFWYEVLADALPSAFYQRALVWWDAPFVSLLSALAAACLFLVTYALLVTLSLRLPHPPLIGVVFPVTLAALLVSSALLSGAAARAVGQYARR